MRAYIIAALAAAILSGCDDTGQNRWPWEKQVPVTKPTTSQPAPAAVKPEQPQPGGIEVVTQDQPKRPASQPTTDASDPYKQDIVAAPLEHTKPLTKEPQVVAQSVVQVNDKFITVEDVLVGARVKFSDIQAGIKEETFRRQAQTIVLEEIRDQMNEVLVSEEADGRLTDEQKEAVDKEMAETEREMIAKAGGSRIHLEQMVLKEGTTLEKMLKDHRRHIETDEYLRAKFTPSIMVNRRLLWDYYQTHKDDFATPKKVQMQTITVMSKLLLPESTQEPTEAELKKAREGARERIEKAAAALKAGQAFEKVAKQYSNDSRAEDGGLWPLMPAGSFRMAKVETAAFALEQGKVSGIMFEGGNFYLVRAAKVQPGAEVSFEDAQEKIEETLRHEQYVKLSEAYYQKLVKRAVVVQADDFVQHCIDRAVERYWGKER